jgi:hypothetical protein
MKSFLVNLITIVLLSTSLSPSSYIPKVSLEPSGEGYFGKYTGNNERYNLDAGIDIAFTLLTWENTEFYIQYINNLEMARQVGNISLDPRYSHTYIIGGFKFNRYGHTIKTYLVHDCKHIIDMLPDSNKVVFNRLKFSLSKHLSNIEEGFQIGMKRENKHRNIRYEFIYGFYPQTEIIDYLNSRPYYHHDFAIRLEFPLFLFQNQEIFAGFEATYVISANTPPKYYRDVSILLESDIFNKKGALGIYIEYYPISEDPMKSPQGLSIVGIRYRF